MRIDRRKVVIGLGAVPLAFTAGAPAGSAQPPPQLKGVTHLPTP